MIFNSIKNTNPNDPNNVANVGEVPYTGWMNGLKIMKTAPRYSKISKILPRPQQ